MSEEMNQNTQAGQPGGRLIPHDHHHPGRRPDGSLCRLRAEFIRERAQNQHKREVFLLQDPPGFPTRFGNARFRIAQIPQEPRERFRAFGTAGSN